jgi:arginase
VAYAVIEAPSVLGLFPGGVEELASALLDAGLAQAIGARRAGRVTPPPYDPARDPATGIRNPTGLGDFSRALADTTGEVLDNEEVPVVLGGDCSVVLGPLLALRRRGRYGMLFIDGHADFYQPDAEPNGEAASMDLALATGRGPQVVTDLEGRRPLVRDSDVVHLGRRDREEANDAGSQRIEDTDITVIDLADVRRDGIDAAVHRALRHLSQLDGFWVHVDCDVLDDEIMPAVDYRLPSGLRWDELTTVIRRAVQSGYTMGFDITIFNPHLDPNGSATHALVQCLANGLRSDPSPTAKVPYAGS